ncbi:hypothetical protein LIER_41907 [Lithospermum erythrorhizon]|uniref:RNase H type-1 domain-containing protein n=1 Tax=Lithospermum erythrorhizon TaxID=34254 RepID=A0AAV3RHR0_LITER
MDPWMELGPLCNHYPDQKGGTRVQELWLNGTWDDATLSNRISPDHLYRVKEVFIDQGKPDILLWKSSKDGHYSFKSIYEELVHMIQGKIAHWKAQNKITQIAALISSSSSTLTHIFRERNMAADWIAKNSWKKRQQFVWEADTRHIGMKNLIQLEISGLPQIRLG